MGRLISILLAVWSTAATAYADEAVSGRFPRSADDFALPESGITVFRTGSFGSGAFPYRAALPGLPLSVRLDGAALDAFSPFGADMETLPAVHENFSAAALREEINISLADSLPERPVTTVDFLSGVGRRSRFLGLFRRKIGERSEMRVSGLSDGRSGGGSIEGNSFRRYDISFRKPAGNDDGARVRAGASGSRDRLDIIDIGAGKRTGQRTIDAVQFTAGADRIRFARNTALSASWSIRNGRTRFARGGKTEDFDDDAIAFETRLSPLGGTSWEAALRYHSRLLDDRNGNLSRRYGTATLDFTKRMKMGGAEAAVDGSLLHSGRFGTGHDGEIEIVLPVGSRAGMVARGTSVQGFPGPEHEFYSILSYGGDAGFADLRRYRIVGIEAGITVSRGIADFGAFGFGGRSDVPVFVPAPAGMRMSGPTGYSGIRGVLDARRRGTTDLSGSLVCEYTNGKAVGLLWPRPSLRIDARGEVARDFFSGVLHGTLFSDVRVFGWRSGPAAPDGSAVFIATGARIRVSSLAAHYLIENLTNDRFRMLGPIRMEGRNASWGVRWSLND